MLDNARVYTPVLSTSDMGLRTVWTSRYRSTTELPSVASDGQDSNLRPVDYQSKKSHPSQQAHVA